MIENSFGGPPRLYEVWFPEDPNDHAIRSGQGYTTTWHDGRPECLLKRLEYVWLPNYSYDLMEAWLNPVWTECLPLMVFSKYLKHGSADIH